MNKNTDGQNSFDRKTPFLHFGQRNDPKLKQHLLVVSNLPWGKLAWKMDEHGQWKVDDLPIENGWFDGDSLHLCWFTKWSSGMIQDRIGWPLAQLKHVDLSENGVYGIPIKWLNMGKWWSSNGFRDFRGAEFSRHRSLAKINSIGDVWNQPRSAVTQFVQHSLPHRTASADVLRSQRDLMRDWDKSWKGGVQNSSNKTKKRVHKTKKEEFNELLSLKQKKQGHVKDMNISG